MPAILIVLLLEDEVDHHDAGVGPQERAVERGGTVTEWPGSSSNQLPRSTSPEY